MLTEVDLILKMDEIMGDLNKAVDKLIPAGMDLSAKETKYRILARQKTLIERSNGTPVSLIDKIVAGDEEVAEARQLRDNAETIQKALYERINVLKKQLDTLRDQASREWSVRSSDYYGQTSRFE